MVGGLGRVTGPLWAGMLFQSAGIAMPFYTGAGLVLLALLVALRIPRSGVEPAEARGSVAAD